MISELNEKLGRIAEVQAKLARRIVERPIPIGGEIQTVGAVDVSYGDTARAAFVLCSYPDCEVLKARVIETEVPFPYVSTFFFLRETRPILLAAKGGRGGSTSSSWRGTGRPIPGATVWRPTSGCCLENRRSVSPKRA